MIKRHILRVVVVSWALLAPAHAAMGAVMALPVVDLVLALAVARKNGQSVTSGGLKRTVAKILMYELAVILAYVTQATLTGDLVPALRIVAGLIGVTELKSCLEHLDEMSGGSFFKTAIDRLTGQQRSDDDVA